MLVQTHSESSIRVDIYHTHRFVARNWLVL